MFINNFYKYLLQVSFLALLIFFCQSPSHAQTAPEQQCFNAVQGKVAWNQVGNTTWSEANIRNLCQGKTNPSATVSCFQNEIRTHNDWSRGINTCKAKTTSPTTNSSSSTQPYQQYLGGEPSKTDVMTQAAFLVRLDQRRSRAPGGPSGGASNGSSNSTSNTFTLTDERGLPFLVDQNYPAFYIIPLEKRPRIMNQGNCNSCTAWATSTALATILANEGKYKLFISGMHLPDAMQFYQGAGRQCPKGSGLYLDEGVGGMISRGVRISIVESASNGGSFNSSLATPMGDWLVKVGKAGSLTNPDAMRKFIATKGALVADIDITPDFNRYYNGIYNHTDFVSKIIKPLILINQKAAADQLEKELNKKSGSHSLTVVGYFKGGPLKLRDFMKPTLPANADLSLYGNIELPNFPAFWIVQNSWGDWGMNGLIYIAADQSYDVIEKDGSSSPVNRIDDIMYYMLEPKITSNGKEIF